MRSLALLLTASIMLTSPAVAVLPSDPKEFTTLWVVDLGGWINHKIRKRRRRRGKGR